MTILGKVAWQGGGSLLCFLLLKDLLCKHIIYLIVTVWKNVTLFDKTANTFVLGTFPSTLIPPKRAYNLVRVFDFPAPDSWTYISCPPPKRCRYEWGPPWPTLPAMSSSRRRARSNLKQTKRTCQKIVDDWAVVVAQMVELYLQILSAFNCIEKT